MMIISKKRFDCLLELLANKDYKKTKTNIAKNCNITHTNCCIILSELYAYNMIEFTNDGRNKICKLTPEGVYIATLVKEFCERLKLIKNGNPKTKK